jgi:hypothetical protein
VIIDSFHLPNTTTGQKPETPTLQPPTEHGRQADDHDPGKRREPETAKPRDQEGLREVEGPFDGARDGARDVLEGEEAEDGIILQHRDDRVDPVNERDRPLGRPDHSPIGQRRFQRDEQHEGQQEQSDP